MAENLEMMKVQVKESILLLINNNKLTEASKLLNDYQQMVSDDPEIFSMRCVIDIKNGQLDDAEETAKQGLALFTEDFDLRYNLAYLYELKKQYAKAAKIYLDLNKGSYDTEKLNLAMEGFRRLETQYKGVADVVERKKIKVFVKAGLDTFIDDIIHGLADKYDVKKLIVTDLEQIHDEMLDADICWFEWCDELVIHASKLAIAKDKKIMCRLHSYEAFTDYPAKVNWATVDKVIFVAEHIRDAVLENTPSLKQEKTIIVPNGIVLNNYVFKTRKSGFKIAYVGYINYKKGPMLLLHAFKAIYDQDHRYKLYIAGTFQDGRDVLYFRQMINEFGLEKNVFYEGWQSDVNNWLDDKDYIICTSILEGHPVGIMEAMAKGIKPLIHNFVGARKIFPQKYIWNTVGECIEQLTASDYSSNEYRQVIEKQYSKQQQLNNILAAIQGIDSNQGNSCTNKPSVTVGVLNYNQANYLVQCLDSVLEQDYQNTEILIIDDGSTDNSLDIINKYTSKYNVRLICFKKNSGSTAKGIQTIQEQANGEYFTYLKAEDYYPDKDIISTYVTIALENENIDFIYGNQRIINNKGETVGFNKYTLLDGNEIIRQAFGDFCFSCMTMHGLYKNSFYIRNKLNWQTALPLKKGNEVLNCIINIKHDWQYKNIDREMLCCRQQIHPHDLGDAVQEISVITEYIADNFLEEVYLPQVKWHDVNDPKLRHAMKMYHLGAFFYEKYIGYMTECSISAATGENAELLFRILEPLAHKCLKYFRNSLKADNTFADDIEKRKAQIALFKKRLRDFSPLTKAAEQLPKVSIVIPTYNRKDMLKRALESSLVQDYSNLEIIVTDNASTDGTQELMKMYTDDIRVKYTRHEKNMGSGYNFCNGYRNLATGKYVLLLNDDDLLIDSGYITKAMNLVKQDPSIVLIHANCKILNEKTNEISLTDFQSTGIFNGLGYFLNYERRQTCPHIMGTVTAVIRRDLLLDMAVLASSAQNNLAGDLIMYLFVMLWGKGNVGVISDYAGLYRIHPGSVSNGLRALELTGERHDGTIECLEKIALIAIEQGIPEQVIHDWIDYRIWRFIRWGCSEFFSNGQIEKGIEILEYIKERYPKPYNELKAEFIR